MNKTQRIVALAAIVLSSVPAVARADNAAAISGSGVSALSATDQSFIAGAALAGKFEIESSRLANKKSSNADVKSFAHTMITDHKKAAAKLEKIAKGLNVTPPQSLDTEKQGLYDDLKGATGSDFDQKYISDQDKGHQEAVALFQKESQTGDNPQLKAFATQTLPTLQEHAEMVKMLEAKLPPAATSVTK